MLEDTDSGVVCTDQTDIDNDNSDTKQEDSNDSNDPPENTKYNLASRRVYLNHRNITKMKDIKYKRITKSKSKSMEELRDKLRKGLHFLLVFQ